MKITETFNQMKYARQSQGSVLSFKSSLYKNIDVNSADYIKYIYRRSRNMCRKPIDINIETGRLLDIVNSDEPFIFIMNHTSRQSKDIVAAQFFNTLLYREYIYNDKASTCPRSKIFASSGFFKKMSNKAEEFKWMGVLPVNVGWLKRGKDEQNSITLKNVVKDLVANKINFFLFPEGIFASLSLLPMKYKFQPGVSAIIKRVLEIKDKIKVIPLGFAHNEKDSSIHIGKAVAFSKKNNHYFVDRGNVDSACFDKNFAKLYANKDSLLLTNNGQPVEENDIVPYISGVLVKNLEACVKEAEEDLEKSSGEVFEI